MSVPVVPTPLVTSTPTIYGFNYTVQSFQLNTQITFNVILVDENSSPLKVSQVCISGDDYQAWGNNDSYVVDYICTALGLTLATPSDPEPAPSDPEPAPSDPEPAPSDPEPAPSDPEPAPSDPEPAPSDPEPAPSDPEPAI